MTVVSLAGVSVRLGGRTVLSDVSLSIAEGLFVGVLGPNGAGKTTLMRALLGLVPADGDIRVLGAAPRRGNPAIGYLPQTRTLAPAAGLRAYDVLAASVRGAEWGPALTGRADRSALDAALASVGAAQFARRPLGSLSGGERQLLLLAEALVGEPKLLLLDEPLLGLDPRRQHEVVALVRSLVDRRGLTVLFSAHELGPLLGAVDRILYLGHGNAALGTPDEVVRPEVLSRLYGAEVEVIRAGGHIFVVSEGHDLERDAHLHDHHDGDSHPLHHHHH